MLFCRLRKVKWRIQRRRVAITNFPWKVGSCQQCSRTICFTIRITQQTRTRVLESFSAKHKSTSISKIRRLIKNRGRVLIDQMTTLQRKPSLVSPCLRVIRNAISIKHLAKEPKNSTTLREILEMTLSMVTWWKVQELPMKVQPSQPPDHTMPKIVSQNLNK